MRMRKVLVGLAVLLAAAGVASADIAVSAQDGQLCAHSEITGDVCQPVPSGGGGGAGVGISCVYDFTPSVSCDL